MNHDDLTRWTANLKQDEKRLAECHPDHPAYLIFQNCVDNDKRIIEQLKLTSGERK